MKILFTGATGFLGSAFTQTLVDDEHQVYAWVRNLNKAKTLLDSRVKCFERLEAMQEKHFDAVVNLAGEPIVDKRWTPSRKSVLRSSRIDLTHDLVNFINTLDHKPGVMLSASAIGYYGSQSDDVPHDETSNFIPGFSHTLCADWEAAAMALASDLTRVCLLRTGIVLGLGGGALGKMLFPFKCGLGGPIGNGMQIMSWIHRQDWINACLYLLLNDELSGPFNLVSPNAVNNKKFTKALANTLNRPAIFTVPCLILRLAMGESAELLCEGQRVLPKKLLDAGYRFTFSDIDDAFADII